MHVFAINLKNFRCFEDHWVFPNEQMNVLVGPNNSGKTTILHALALLLDASINTGRPGVGSRFDFHNVNVGQPVELYAWLKPRGTQSPSGFDDNQTQYAEPDEVNQEFFDKLSERAARWPVRGEDGKLTTIPI